MSTQPLNIISRYGEDDISLWTVNVEFEDYKRVAGNAVQLKVELSRYLHRGSPPHTRGKGRYMRQPRVIVGITPAHAGKSDSSVSFSIVKQDHPRTRGEKLLLFWQYPINRGSPPHTRGKAKTGSAHIGCTRITPAHAGKRNLLPVLWAAPGDHPRTRGEKSQNLRNFVRRQGSPPHTRGKVQEIHRQIPRSGITPARAGKSGFFFLGGNSRKDHPRTRGEKAIRMSDASSSVGSPPHARGKVVQLFAFCVCHGITPARAGKSYFRRCHLRAG